MYGKASRVDYLLHTCDAGNERDSELTCWGLRFGGRVHFRKSYRPNASSGWGVGR
jgi:hypothetical protein